eukprot:4814697-Alexandrium_andersonii.AAC.1
MTQQARRPAAQLATQRLMPQRGCGRRCSCKQLGGRYGGRRAGAAAGSRTEQQQALRPMLETHCGRRSG